MEGLVPIFICAVMPIAIVLIVFLAAMNSDNKRAKVLIKAIEHNNAMDVDKLAEALRKPRRTPLQLLNLRLLRGCIFTLIGISLLLLELIICLSVDEDVNDIFSFSVLGCISIAVGISYLIVYFVTRNQVTDKE